MPYDVARLNSYGINILLEKFYRIFGAAEQAVQGKEKKIDPAMGLVDQALDIIAAIENSQ